MGACGSANSPCWSGCRLGLCGTTADVLRGLSRGSRFAELDQELLALVDTAAGPQARAEFAEMLRPPAEPEARRRGAETYARLDEIADAPPDDPRVAALAADLADHLPGSLAVLMAEQEADVGWMEELSAAQREVFRQLSRILRERAC